jgi:hypothetical protein
MNLKEIEILINKPALTVGDKKAIRAAADAAGLKYTVKQGCRDCYDKLLLRLYEMADGKELNTSLDGWRFRDARRSFLHNGIVYSNETIVGLRVGHLHPVILKANFVRAEKEGEETE